MNYTVPQIVTKLVQAKKAYYEDGKPIMSDYDYDKLEIALRRLDPRHPALGMVGYSEDYEWWVEHYNGSPVSSNPPPESKL